MKIIEYFPKEKITHTVIALHGLGGSGDNVYPLAQELKLPGVRFVFPTADAIPITINQGYVMPAWYDFSQPRFDDGAHYDELRIDAACNAIRAMIANEQARYGIEPDHIFLMGFSQGGSIALEVGLHYPTPLAGIIGLSTLPAKALQTFENTSAASKKTPIFLAHGRHDDVLPLTVGEKIRHALTRLEYRLAWHTYAMRHEICAQELIDLRDWFAIK